MKVGGEDNIGGEDVVHFPVVTSPKDDALEMMVGQVVLEFARLEHIVKAGIEILYRRTRNGGGAEVPFSEGMGMAEGLRAFEKHCDELRRLYPDTQEDQTLQQAFAALMEDIKRLGRIRNAIVHSAFSPLDDGRYALLRTKVDKKALKQAAFVVTMAELRDFFHHVNHRRFLLAMTLDGRTGTLGATVPMLKSALIEGLDATGDEF